jgi:hypothetical protein
VLRSLQADRRAPRDAAPQTSEMENGQNEPTGTQVASRPSVTSRTPAPRRPDGLAPLHQPQQAQPPSPVSPHPVAPEPPCSAPPL